MLEFFHESDVEGLLIELQQIASKSLGDREWEKFWYDSRAYSFPKNAEASNRLVQLVVKEILERRTPKAG